MSRVAITGACGNLGQKLIRHLMLDGRVSRIVGLDLRTPTEDEQAKLQEQNAAGRLEFVTCDLANWDDRRWKDQLANCDALVHFAAQNPFPEASWNDANVSLDMTMNLALAATDAGVRRFVFVSSNHVMGRYLQEPLASSVGPGELTTDREHAVGTLWNTGSRAMDSTVYAVAKSSGERLCRALGQRSEGATTFVCIRVGWCQPGENLPATLSAAGTPTQGTQSSKSRDWELADQWFKNMWLSNRDFTQLFEKAIFVDGSGWPDGCIIVNGMSANMGMKWSLKEARAYLDYRPLDDVSRGTV